MKSSKHKNAIFFLSTGRCATQFFADKLDQHYADLARVTHEPFSEHYHPRHYFASLHQGAKVELDPPLQQHIESIEETLEDKHYIETGWPAYGLLPYLVERFTGRVKVVHLFRHPLMVASSLLTHNVYDRGEWSDNMSILPSDLGVVQDYLAGDQWDKMTQFSKCLFWWTEINNFALEFHKSSTDLPWFSMRFEDVFSEEGSSHLEDLISFLELPKREAFTNSLSDKVDQFPGLTYKKIDINEIKKYDESMRVMGNLGYILNDSVANEVDSRYKRPFIQYVLQKLWRRTQRYR